MASFAPSLPSSSGWKPSNTTTIATMTRGGRSLQAADCGRLLNKFLEMSEGCQGKDCERSYYLYLPCTETAEVVPLMFAVHCYGCTFDTMKFWKTEAEEYGFALVIPQGIKRAFNARVCCGYPLEENVDDKAFFREIINNQLPALYPGLTSPEIAYAVGWSNGGYMTTYTAELFRAIAPIAGFQYDYIAALSPNHPVGLFLHHAVDDPNVRATGCCTDSSMPACCCGISEASPEVCLSAEGFVEQFGQDINGCSADDWQDVTIDGMACRTGGPSCQKPTTYCLHPTGKHFNAPTHEQAVLSFRPAIIDFFARDACGVSGGEWNAESRQCTCSSSGLGRYCLSGAASETAGTNERTSSEYATESVPSSSASVANEWNAVIVPFVLTLILAAIGSIGFQRYKANRDKYSGFQVAPTVEMSSTQQERKA